MLAVLCALAMLAAWRLREPSTSAVREGSE
jgi:hypothetical protein